jgi:GH15 family glucan-1,4-alpha-glucosidase
MPLVKFISPTDPKWLSTLDALTASVVSDSLVYRYDPKASPDGVRGDGPNELEDTSTKAHGAYGQTAGATDWSSGQ